MSERSAQIPRLTLHVRVQHGALAFCALFALGTGLLLGVGGAATARIAPSTLAGLHLWMGVGAVAVLLYHLAHLAVVGYVEGLGRSAFPLRLGAADRRAAIQEISFVLGRHPERPEAEDFRVSQKALYWGTIACVAGAASTGLLIAFWDRFGTLGSLGGIAELHRGFALLLLASLVWHLYGVLVWEGAWEPEWSWVTGTIDEGKARRKLPGFVRRLEQEREEREAGRGRSREVVEEERRRFEKDEVQTALAAGNQLALEEKFVEALYHYRRALELYPEYSQARYNMARVLARMGEKAMAREAFGRFVEADPFHPLAEKARQAMRELAEDEEQ